MKERWVSLDIAQRTREVCPKQTPQRLHVPSESMYDQPLRSAHISVFFGAPSCAHMFRRHSAAVHSPTARRQGLEPGARKIV
jgi:hypothetical protein